MTVEIALPAAIPRESRVPPGFTAIGLVVIAAVAYSIRIAIDPAAGNNVLTATFLLANVIGWLLGWWLRQRNSRSTIGFLLVLLGDAIFPLNLFAPLLLFVPGLRGDVPLTCTAVVLVGLAYHLYNYWHRTSARFALPFYPYFFAVIGGTGIYLLRFTAGLPLWSVAWLVLLYAVAFNEFSYRKRPEPAVHFAIASATILTASIIVSCFAYRDRNVLALAAIVAATIVLIASAIRERNDEAMGRAHGLAAWLGVTLTFTALLYAAHSPLWVYLVATGAWTIILAFISTRQGSGWSEPFPESAWWAVMLLSTALAIALWKVWMPFIVRTLAARPLAEAATVALFEAGLALLLVSIWRRRYPSIAATVQGFVANNVLLRLTSYAAPLFLIVAFAGAWSVLHGPVPASFYAPLIAGTLLLVLGPRLERHIAGEALDFAGLLAMVFAAFNALGSALLGALVLFAAALIFLVRYLRGARPWTFAAFLLLMAAGLALQTLVDERSTFVFLAAAAVVTWGSTRAAALGSRTLARIGFWCAHAVALLFWLSLARVLWFGPQYDAAVVAIAAWRAFAAWRLSDGLASRTALHACLVLAAGSVVLLFMRQGDPYVLIVTLLALGALLLELPNLNLIGFGFLAAAVVLAANRTEGPWLAGVLGVCAMVLLWRSLVRESSFAHLMFIACAAACAALLMPDRGGMKTLPVAILVALFCLVELWSIRKPSSFHADVTSVVALVLAVTILVAEVVSERFSIAVVAVLIVAAFAIRAWIVSAGHHRVQPAAHAAFTSFGIVALAIAAVAGARMAGLRPGQQLFVLAVTSWLVLGWLLRSRSRIAAAALHVIALGVYVAAAVIRGSDPFVIAACITAAGAYLAWRAAHKDALLEHLAAVGLIEAVWLWGFANGVTWPELYLSAVAAYLCIVLLRGTAPRAENAIAVIVIVAAIAYPYYALLRTAQAGHLAFLGIAGIVVIHVLLASRRHVLMVVTVCAMLGLGMLSGAVLHDDVRLNLLMALVGFIVIADLGLIGIRSDRRPLVGEIDYDDNRVTR